MSAFDELFAKLTEKNLSDNRVDEILKAGEALASVLGDTPDVLEEIAALRIGCVVKKTNKDINDIDNPKELNEMFDDYAAKAKKDPNVVNHSREAAMAYKMQSLVSSGKMEQTEALDFCKKLMETDCMTNGSYMDKNTFRDSIVATYEYCGYKSYRQQRMDNDVKKLDAQLSGKEFVPEREGDLYSKDNVVDSAKGNKSYQSEINTFKDGAKSYEAGSGLFDRCKKLFKEAWSSSKVEENSGFLNDLQQKINKRIDSSLKDSSKLSLAICGGAVLAGCATVNPALAAAGASMFTVAVMKLYNEKIKGKLNEKSGKKASSGEPKEEKGRLSAAAGNSGVVAIHSIVGGRNEKD